MTQGYKFSWAELEILKQNWKKFADENRGEFRLKTVDSFNISSQTFKLTIPFLDNKITFYSTEFKPLKISYSFDSVNFNEFLIYPEDLTDKIGKLFGIKEIEIGDSTFDRNFIIRGNNESFIKKLLNEEMKRFLMENSISNFKLEKTEHETTLELNVAINELEIEKMKEALSVFKNSVTIIKTNNLP